MLTPPKIAEEGDPICGYIHPIRGQCRYMALVKGGNCVLHGGGEQRKAEERKAIYGRLNEEYRARIQEKTAHKDHYALNEEVGILRMLLEEILAKTQGDQNLFLRSAGQISELVTKIEKVVISAQKAEKYIGGLLSRDQALQMFQEAINVIADYVEDQDVLDKIATKLDSVANRKYEDATE